MSDVSIVALLDRTGSMQAIKTDTEGAFDAFIAEQRELTKTLDDNVLVTLVQFDKAPGQPTIEVVYENMPLADVPPLKLLPRGLTPLNDAMGLTIAKAENAVGKVIMVVMTDGQENASSEYTTEQIKKLVDEHRVRGWEFIFLGVGIDGFEVGAQMGFATADTSSTPHTGAGTRQAYAAAGQSVSTYRTKNKEKQDQ